MSQTNIAKPALDSWQQFDKTTSRWGRLTMIAAVVLMLAGPAILALQVGINWLTFLGVLAAVAAVFGAIWFIEPLSYFPILGPASMYQAFMIGNISNKLLPAAIVAQSTIEAKPETRRGQLASVLAICGAALTHLTGLIIFVGILGTLLIKLIPAEIISTVEGFVLPAIMGGVIVQMVVSNLQPRVLIISLLTGAVIVFVLMPLFPVVAYFATALAVVVTVALAILTSGKKKEHVETAEAEDIS